MTYTEVTQSLVVEESLYLSTVGDANDSEVAMPEMIIPGALTETQVSVPVENNSSGSEKDVEVQ